MIKEILGIILNLISHLGPLIIFIVIMLEQMAMPISSVIILPFIGVLVYIDIFFYEEVMFWGISGGLVGSIAGYYMGISGVKLNSDYGNFNYWFNRYGEKAVFICRLLPMTRNLISIVSGIKKINFKAYIAYSSLGITVWNVFLVVIGYFVGGKINSMEGALKICYIAGYFSIILTLIYFLVGKFKNREL